MQLAFHFAFYNYIVFISNTRFVTFVYALVISLFV